MATLIYLHGFLSSPRSHKAVVTHDWLAEQRPDIRYECPFIPPYPRQARRMLLDTLEDHLKDDVYLIGSSLGGFWATWLAEMYDLRAVLINPLVDPNRFQIYVDQDLENFYNGDHYRLSQQDIDAFRDFDTPAVNRPENYWLMVQTGDETLDYQLAVEKYRHCRQLVEEGGNHSFEGYANWLPQMLAFLEGRTEDAS